MRVPPMPLSFLRAADWQLGMPIAAFRDETQRHQLSQELLHTMQLQPNWAGNPEMAFVRGAGDHFDSAQVSKQKVSAARSAIGTMGVLVVAIPGNHDHGGAGRSFQVLVPEGGAAGLELIPPRTPAYVFATLSGGASEQAVASVRLSVAEILASDPDCYLSLVFDDPFAYSDPDRIQALQCMLDLAAIRGLQVIVLTCAPTDYSGIGASEYRISA